VFGRATIRLGIGPHSSFYVILYYLHYSVMYAAVRSSDHQVAINLSSMGTKTNVT